MADTRIFGSLPESLVGLASSIAWVADGLMTRFAIVAHKGEILDAHGAEAEFLNGATVGAFAVGRQTGQLAHFLFCHGERHFSAIFCSIIY